MGKEQITDDVAVLHTCVDKDTYVKIKIVTHVGDGGNYYIAHCAEVPCFLPVKGLDKNKVIDEAKKKAYSLYRTLPKYFRDNNCVLMFTKEEEAWIKNKLQ